MVINSEKQANTLVSWTKHVHQLDLAAPWDRPSDKEKSGKRILGRTLKQSTLQNHPFRNYLFYGSSSSAKVPFICMGSYWESVNSKELSQKVNHMAHVWGCILTDMQNFKIKSKINWVWIERDKQNKV